MAKNLYPSSIFFTTLPTDRLHPIFIHIRDSEACAEDRLYIEKMWAIFKPYADRNFHDQFQRDFPSRVWEMRLACLLLDQNFKLESSGFGPDLGIRVGGLAVWFEAIAPEPGTNELEIKLPRKDTLRRVPEELIFLRYTSALEGKYAKYCDYIKKGIVTSKDVFVIALSASKLPGVRQDDKDIPHIVKVLYGIGDPFFNIQTITGKIVDSGYTIRESIAKPISGTDIRTDWFLDKTHEGISAVLYEPDHIKNRPEVWGRSPDSNLILVHNLYASKMLPRSAIRVGNEWDCVDGKLKIINRQAD